MRRKHQCGTIQLDFNNPIRFNLQYRKEGEDDKAEEGAEAEEKVEFKGAEEKNEKGDVIWKEGRLKNGFERPVVIHRAILGSIERMSAILIEHYAGKWPLWLSPRQVMVVPVGEKFNEYAQWVEKQLTLFGFYAESECSGKTLNKKVRESQLAQWNYIAVVGEKEMTDLTVNIRQRDVERPLGTLSMVDFMAKLDMEAMPVSQPLRVFEPFQGKSPEVAKPAAPAAPASGRPTLQKQGSLAMRAQGGKFANLQVDDCVETFLESHPYVKGFMPSSADVELFEQLTHSGFPETPNLKRWFEHMESFGPKEREGWPAA
jgi:hypothetical protein